MRRKRKGKNRHFERVFLQTFEIQRKEIQRNFERDAVRIKGAGSMSNEEKLLRNFFVIVSSGTRSDRRFEITRR